MLHISNPGDPHLPTRYSLSSCRCPVLNGAMRTPLQAAIGDCEPPRPSPLSQSIANRGLPYSATLPCDPSHRRAPTRSRKPHAHAILPHQVPTWVGGSNSTPARHRSARKETKNLNIYRHYNRTSRVMAEIVPSDQCFIHNFRSAYIPILSSSTYIRFGGVV